MEFMYSILILTNGNGMKMKFLLIIKVEISLGILMIPSLEPGKLMKAILMKTCSRIKDLMFKEVME